MPTGVFMHSIIEESALRDFWYPVIPIEDLENGPSAFTLLGEKMVLWLDAEGQPAAIRDRCNHRYAQLSLGKTADGLVLCPYHGWRFDRMGKCINISQAKKTVSRCDVDPFHCQAAYGYAWVCLGQPRSEIPFFPEEHDPGFRRIHCFYETWNANPIRVMENELDMSHFPFVHDGTFGDNAAVNPIEYEVYDRGSQGVGVHAVLDVKADDLQAANTKMDKGKSCRTMAIEWYIPFTIRLAISYSSGLEHVIINNAVPMENGEIKILQFHFRNDREEQVSVEQLLAFERRIVAEDRRVIESIDPNLPLDPAREAHIPTDRAGLLMRDKLFKLFQSS
uniref:Phenylpropionate dioxygenase, large terminal subunit n=1 Tax=Candidatus Kentrum sp. LFY TaxID=2126342 RepID=A0A450UMB2_9GAMM|nr:MAG: Phenylpropionate dioxygenase, large terminal subunit [Candidatus Kentron sp. LFY]